MKLLTTSRSRLMKDLKSENRSKAIHLTYLIVLVLILLCLLTSLWALLFARQQVIISGEDVSSGVFGMILTGVSIVLAAAIIIPRVALKSSVEEEVNSAMENKRNEIRSILVEEFDKRFFNEIDRVDAHMSRMVSHFLLNEKDFIWATGWMLRSANRYYTLVPERIGLAGYKDLFTQLSKGLETAIKGLEAQYAPKGDEGKAELNVNKELFLNYLTDTAKGEGTRGIVAVDRVRKVVRLFKDLFDLEFAVLRRCHETLATDGKSRKAPNEQPVSIELPAEERTVLLFLGRLHAQLFSYLHTLSTDDMLRQHGWRVAQEIIDISYTVLDEDDVNRGEFMKRMRQIGESLGTCKASTVFTEYMTRYTELQAARPEVPKNFKFLLDMGNSDVYEVRFA